MYKYNGFLCNYFYSYLTVVLILLLNKNFDVLQ